MNVEVLLVGCGALVVLAVLAGRADARAHERAWKAIAELRRARWEERQRVAALLDALAEEAGVCQCPGCRRVRRTLGRE